MLTPPAMLSRLAAAACSGAASGAQTGAAAPRHHRAASGGLRHRPGAHATTARASPARRAAWSSRSPAAPATATDAPAHGGQYRRRATAISGCSISASPRSSPATATSTASIRSTTVNEEVVEAVEGEARRDGSGDRGQAEAAGGEDRPARRRRAVPEPAPAGDPRRRAGRPQVPVAPRSTRAPARARRATRRPPRSASASRRRCEGRFATACATGRSRSAISTAKRGREEDELGEETADLPDALHALRERRHQRPRHGLWRLRAVRLAGGDRAARRAGLPVTLSRRRSRPGAAKVSPSASPSRAEARADRVHRALGLGALARRPVDQVAPVGEVASPRSATPMPISRKRVPSSSFAQQVAARLGRCGRRGWSAPSSRALRVRSRKSPVFSFSTTSAAGEALPPSGAATPSRTARAGSAAARRRSAMSRVEGGLGRDALRLRARA